MPLENAKEGTPGFGRNIATEVKAGKPVKQAAAIAYSKARGDADDDEIKRLEDKLGDLSDPNGPEAKRLKERIKTLRKESPVKKDASDAALRSLSYLRDELSKVKSEQSRAKGAEKWSYDDYIKAINAKIDKLQAVAAKADSDVTASVVRGQPTKPGTLSKPDGEKLRKILFKTDSLNTKVKNRMELRIGAKAKADADGSWAQKLQNAAEAVARKKSTIESVADPKGQTAVTLKKELKELHTKFVDLYDSAKKAGVDVRKLGYS